MLFTLPCRRLRSNAVRIAKLARMRAARRGVKPRESGVFGLAPWANSARTMSTRLFCIARIKAVCPFASSAFTSTLPASAACRPLMSPLLAASHNSSGGVDPAAAGVGAGWIADGVAPGGVGVDAVSASVPGTGGICGAGAGAESAGGPGRAPCVVMSAWLLAIGALCRAAAFCRATRARVSD